MIELEMKFTSSELQLATVLLVTLSVYISFLNITLMFDQPMFWDLYLWGPSSAQFYSYWWPLLN